MCTSSIDKLGKEVYDNPCLVYKYRGSVNGPPLEMVDNIITTSECGSTTVAPNATVNSFVERKKLELSYDKCARIHMGKQSQNQECHNIKVDKEDMKTLRKKNT